MNKKLVLLFSILLSMVGYATAQEISTITGSWLLHDVEQVNLYTTKNGELVPEATSVLNSKKEFIFAINQSESGFYTIGTSPNARSYKYNFYMKPGDRLNVTMLKDSVAYKLVGDKNSAENIEMARWFDIIKDAEYMANYSFYGRRNYLQYFPVLEELVEINKNYVLKEPVEQEFAKKFEDFRKFDLMHSALVFLYSPRSVHPHIDEHPDFIKGIDLTDLTKDDKLLGYPYGKHFVGLLKMNQTSKDSETGVRIVGKTIEEEANIQLATIGSKVLKGDVAASIILRHGVYADFMKAKEEYGSYLVTDEQKQSIKDKELLLSKSATGVIAPDFKFRDKTGKIVSLSDFKGKVVYIDVWATWCAPCLGEAPFWKALYEANKSKDIVFLGISIDDEKDHAKWLKHLEKEGDIGVQLFAGKDVKAGLADPYEVRGVPRFILVGKDGKIVEHNAIRPSNPEVQTLLDQTLAK